MAAGSVEELQMVSTFLFGYFGWKCWTNFQDVLVGSGSFE